MRVGTWYYGEVVPPLEDWFGFWAPLAVGIGITYRNVRTFGSPLSLLLPGITRPSVMATRTGGPCWLLPPELGVAVPSQVSCQLLPSKYWTVMLRTSSAMTRLG